MELNHPTLLDRVINMTDQELRELANAESLSIANSSKLEGLELDQIRIHDQLLEGYRAIQNKRVDNNI